MKTYSPWTEQECEILTKFYPSHGAKYCKALLPNRTENAIRTRVVEMKLYRSDQLTCIQKAGVTEEWVVSEYYRIRSAVKVGKSIGVSPTPIREILRKHNVGKILHFALENRKEEFIADYTKEELTLKEICTKYDISMVTLRDSVNRWQLKPLAPHRNKHHQSLSGGWSRHSKNETYFDIIDTPEKAYWLGLIYADGYNGDTKGWVLHLGLQKRDVNLLEKLSMTLLGRIMLKEIPAHTHKWKNHTINGHGAYVFRIYSRHLSEALTRAGAHTAKSQTLRFPTPDQVPNHLLRHFMLGYFDGDGCLTSHERPPYRRRYTFSLISTREFCESFQGVLFKELGVKAILHKQLKMTILVVNGNEKIEKTMNWMYGDSSLWLERKRAVYTELCEYNKAHPDPVRYSCCRGITFDKTKKTRPWLASVIVDGKKKRIAVQTEEEAISIQKQFNEQQGRASTSGVLPL